MLKSNLPTQHPSPPKHNPAHRNPHTEQSDSALEGPLMLMHPSTPLPHLRPAPTGHHPLHDGICCLDLWPACVALKSVGSVSWAGWTKGWCAANGEVCPKGACLHMGSGAA